MAFIIVFILILSSVCQENLNFANKYNLCDSNLLI